MSQSIDLSGTRWVLHSSQFCERGDSVNAFEMHAVLLSCGATDVSIMFDSHNPRNSPMRIQEARERGLAIRPYSSQGNFLREIRSSGVTHFYNFTAGRLSDSNFSRRWPHRWRFGDYVVINHVVFRHFEPHGDIYVYVSDWLHEWSRLADRSGVFSPTRRILNPFINPAAVIGSLPHSVTIVPGDGVSFRKRYSIPESAFVLGRIGGADQFDDPVAMAAVKEWISASKGNYFVGVNTTRFLHHDRALFLPPLDRSGVADFFASIDVQINGRRMGESFGLSIVEGLRCGVPTIAPCECRNPKMDKHHISILRHAGWLYCTVKDILALLSTFKTSSHHNDAVELIDNRFTRDSLRSKLLDLLSSNDIR